MTLENGTYSLPTNIKQIGGIDEEFRIYMEDYAFTYVQQYSQEAGCADRVAALVGESCKIDGKEVLFISGVIQGQYSEAENSMEVFTEKSWQYINEQLSIYFNGLKIVGWLYVQPGYGDYVNDSIINYHFRNFSESHQVLFVNDPVEKTNVFFVWDGAEKGKRSLRQLKGYIIYYDKNKPMQDYMVENKLSSNKPPIEKAGLSDVRGVRNIPAIEAMRQKKEAPIPKPRTSRIAGRALSEQRKMINLFGSLSAILFLVCFIMGAGLVQNDDRISKLEDKLAAVDSSYKYLMAQINLDNAQSVFAAQNGESEVQAQTQAAQVSTEVQTTAVPTQEPTEVPTEAVTQAPEEATAEASAETSTESGRPETYTVKDGDSLSHISRKFYGSNEMMDEIMDENGIEDPNRIRIGDVIRLP